MNNDLSHTQIIRPLQDSSLAVTEVLERVYEALNEKGTIRSVRLWDMLCPEILLTLRAIRGQEAWL